MENAAGVQAGERPVHLPGLDELIQTVEGEIEDLESLREEIDSGVAAAVTERTSPLCPFFNVFVEFISCSRLCQRRGHVQFTALAEVFTPGKKASI